MNDFLRIRFRTCLRISKDRRKIISNSSLAINYYTQSVFLFLVFVWSTCRYSFFFFSSLQFIENISRTGSTMTSASLRYPKPKVDRARRRSREEGRERKRFFLPGVPYRAIIIVVVIFLFFFFFPIEAEKAAKRGRFIWMRDALRRYFFVFPSSLDLKIASENRRGFRQPRTFVSKIPRVQRRNSIRIRWNVWVRLCVILFFSFFFFEYRKILETGNVTSFVSWVRSWNKRTLEDKD